MRMTKKKIILISIAAVALFIIIYLSVFKFKIGKNVLCYPRDNIRNKENEINESEMAGIVNEQGASTSINKGANNLSEEIKATSKNLYEEDINKWEIYNNTKNSVKFQLRYPKYFYEYKFVKYDVQNAIEPPIFMVRFFYENNGAEFIIPLYVFPPDERYEEEARKNGNCKIEELFVVCYQFYEDDGGFNRSDAILLADNLFKFGFVVNEKIDTANMDYEEKYVKGNEMIDKFLEANFNEIDTKNFILFEKIRNSLSSY